jgi:hypothetical protein
VMHDVTHDVTPARQADAQAPLAPAAAVAALSPHADADADAPVAQAVPTPAEQALDAVWARYRADVAALAAAGRLVDVPAWQDILRARLADEELINIDARDQFEWRIVHTLADGWRPGHEALFPAAIEVFGWADERGALERFGYYGNLLNQAIDEHALFFAQEIVVRSVQQRITMLLRREKPADPIEIRHSMGELEAMQARFPALLLVVTNRDNIEHWHTVHAQHAANDLPSEPRLRERLARWWVYACLVFVAFLVLRFIYNHNEAPQRQPAVANSVPTAEMVREQVIVIAYAPPSNARPGEYTAKYQVLLDADRSVLAVNLRTSSGEPRFDEAVATALRTVRPFPQSTFPGFTLPYAATLRARTPEAQAQARQQRDAPELAEPADNIFVLSSSLD